MITWKVAAPNPPLKNHTVVPITQHQLLLFGGYTGTLNANAVLIFDVHAPEWTEVHTEGTPPSKRNGHVALLIDQKLVVIGGWDSGVTSTRPLACSDVFELDLNTWTWNSWPVELHSNMCSAVYSHGLIYVFRGGDGEKYHNDLYTINPQTYELIRVEPRGPPPPARANHAGVLIGDSMYVAGGWDGVNRMNDMHRFHIPTHTWSRISTNLPEALSGITLTHYRMANVKDYIVLYGGIGDRYENHVYRQNTHIYMFDLEKEKWSKHHLDNDEEEMPYRANHCFVSFRPDSPEMFLIGGSCDQSYPSNSIVVNLTGFEPDVCIDASGPSSMFEHFFDNEKFSDVRLRLHDHTVPAHRIVLAQANDRFRALFSSGFREMETHEIDISTDVSYETFYEMLRYLYTGSIGDNIARDPIEMLRLSDEYILSHLKQCCEVTLKTALLPDTVNDILEYARYYHAEQLVLYCLYYRNVVLPFS